MEGARTHVRRVPGEEGAGAAMKETAGCRSALEKLDTGLEGGDGGSKEGKVEDG